MNKKLIFGLIFIMLLSVQTISAVKPVIVSSGGLDIIYPSFEHYEQGEDIDFYWHVLNETKLLTNTTVNCSFHLYEKGQEHGYSNNNTMNFIYGRDFEVEVDGGNFTNATEYCRLIECNTATEVGAIESCFTVTATGNAPIGNVSLVFFILLFFGLFVGICYLTLKHFEMGVNLELDLKDVLVSYLAFFVYLMYYYFAFFYWGNEFVMYFLEIFLWVVGFMNLFVVSAMFIFSLINRIKEQS